ncbi:protein YnhH [Scandinavium lactucae]|uniref:protein YnhH n=1 Tax=Scandinavium lactucae TaxID=3095028 RepID=UPI0040464C94
MDCTKNSLKLHPSSVAGNQAHFPLHAYLMSPILISWHCNFRNTGLISGPCAQDPDSHFLLSQLED